MVNRGENRIPVYGSACTSPLQYPAKPDRNPMDKKNVKNSLLQILGGRIV
jgi:hypothetical protein